MRAECQRVVVSVSEHRRKLQAIDTLGGVWNGTRAYGHWIDRTNGDDIFADNAQVLKTTTSTWRLVVDGEECWAMPVAHNDDDQQSGYAVMHFEI